MFTIRQTADGWELVDEDGTVVRRGPLAALVAAVDAPAQMHWEGVITVEGRMTGDGRGADAGAWEWETPFPLTWQREGGGHDGATVVGIVWEVERDGDLIRGRGTFDLDSEEGREAARHVGEGLTRDVSIEPDSVDAELRVAEEVVEAWDQPMDDEFLDDAPERETDDEGRVILDRIHHDDFVEVVTAGRIRTLAMVTTAAYDEATIDLADGVELDALLSGELATEGLAARTGRGFETDDEDDDADPADVGEALGAARSAAEAAAGALSGDDPDVGSARDSIGEVIEEVDAALGMLANDDAASDTDDEDEDDDADDRRGLTAASAARAFDVPEHLVAAGAPTRPPSGWFEDPGLDGPTPITVTDEGRIYGHLAAWGTCHIGRDDVCLTPPSSSAGYAYFTTGETVARCDDGCDGATVRVPTGTVTMGTGHADLSAPPRAAMEHYDNTGTAVADVAAGEDEHGIWIAGALRPGVTDDQARALQGSSLSGDWRRLQGQLELVAALAVNVPGFPIPRGLAASAGVPEALRPRARAAEYGTLALVAAGTLAPTREAPDAVQVVDGAGEQVAEFPADVRRTLARVERALTPQIRDQLRQEVHGGRPDRDTLRASVHPR